MEPGHPRHQLAPEALLAEQLRRGRETYGRERIAVLAELLENHDEALRSRAARLGDPGDVAYVRIRRQNAQDAVQIAQAEQESASAELEAAEAMFRSREEELASAHRRFLEARQRSSEALELRNQALQRTSQAGYSLRQASDAVHTWGTAPAESAPRAERGVTEAEPGDPEDGCAAERDERERRQATRTRVGVLTRELAELRARAERGGE